MRPEKPISNMDAELKLLLSQLHKLPEGQKRQILEDLERREKVYEKEIAQNTFMGFVNRVWPDFIGGRHHKKIGRAHV